MGIRSLGAKPFAKWVVQKNRKWALHPVPTQFQVFENLLENGGQTAFGRQHGLADVRNYEDFKKQVPLQNYEDLRPYLERILEGEADVLWPGQPLYMAKTSGTTSGAKYLPITRESLPNHMDGARDALMHYAHEAGTSKFLDRNMIFLSGSPTLQEKNGLKIGRLSGLVNHHVPKVLKKKQLPSYQTNCIEDWESKLEAIIEETLQAPMSLISGIPPWVQMYFDRIIERTGKPVGEVFPEFSLMVYGGVNFEPYRQKLFESIGRSVDTIETYPASEGFIAFQDSRQTDALMILLNSGIFFEFIPLSEYFQENPRRLHIGEVELNTHYAVVINNNAGLWGYLLGDTVKFVSKKPYRLYVTGRVKHFISAFGEHVIGEEVEKALSYARQYHPEVGVVEFTVAPQVVPEEPDDQPHHEWYIEFSSPPANMPAFERRLDEGLCRLNIYYDDLISGNILRTLSVVPVEPGGFQQYMKAEGKLGGQNKVPRLSNDRKIADKLQQLGLATKL